MRLRNSLRSCTSSSRRRTRFADAIDASACRSENDGGGGNLPQDRQGVRLKLCEPHTCRQH